jgi:hypothetical protein
MRGCCLILGLKIIPTKMELSNSTCRTIAHIDVYVDGSVELANIGMGGRDQDVTVSI